MTTHATISSILCYRIFNNVQKRLYETESSLFTNVLIYRPYMNIRCSHRKTSAVTTTYFFRQCLEEEKVQHNPYINRYKRTSNYDIHHIYETLNPNLLKIRRNVRTIEPFKNTYKHLSVGKELI